MREKYMREKYMIAEDYIELIRRDAIIGIDEIGHLVQAYFHLSDCREEKLQSKLKFIENLSKVSPSYVQNCKEEISYCEKEIISSTQDMLLIRKKLSACGVRRIWREALLYSEPMQCHWYVVDFWGCSHWTTSRDGDVILPTIGDPHEYEISRYN